MPDIFPPAVQQTWEPTLKHFAITTHDSNNFAINTRGIYVGTGGNAVIVTEDGTAVTYKNLQSGAYYPIRAKRVNATNTTAADLVGWY